MLRFDGGFSTTYIIVGCKPFSETKTGRTIVGKIYGNVRHFPTSKGRRSVDHFTGWILEPEEETLQTLGPWPVLIMKIGHQQIRRQMVAYIANDGRMTIH